MSVYGLNGKIICLTYRLKPQCTNIGCISSILVWFTLRWWVGCRCWCCWFCNGLVSHITFIITIIEYNVFAFASSYRRFLMGLCLFMVIWTVAIFLINLLLRIFQRHFCDFNTQWILFQMARQMFLPCTHTVYPNVLLSVSACIHTTRASIWHMSMCDVSVNIHETFGTFGCVMTILNIFLRYTRILKMNFNRYEWNRMRTLIFQSYFHQIEWNLSN